MSKSVIDDAQAAYNAWREAQQGSYLERVLADSIVRDIVPALIHAAERKPMPIGYGTDMDLTADAGIADDE
jgi:hypothetical protein